MKRWRCRRRTCTKHGSGPRKSTKKLIAPRCPSCKNLMILDRYRTSRRDAQKRGLCFCGELKFDPHSPKSCAQQRVKLFEES